MHRLDPHAGRWLDRSLALRFTFEAATIRVLRAIRFLGAGPAGAALYGPQL